MATQRYISTSFWDDEWIRSLDPSEKFVYLYLMTNTLTNIAGVYKITIARICFDTGYNEDTIKKILDRFSESKKAYLYKGYMILPTWPKHQRWDVRPKIKLGIDAILKTLDEDIIKYLKKISYLYPMISYQYDTNYLDIDIDSDIDINIDSDTKEQPKKIKALKKPTIQEVKEYAEKLNYKDFNADRFFYYYEANGWIQNKGKPIVDWKAAVRNWEMNSKRFNPDKKEKQACLKCGAYMSNGKCPRCDDV